MPIMLTWNMQGGQGNYESKWGALAGYITNPANFGLAEAPGIIFLQECSQVPGTNSTYHVAGNLSTYSKNFGSYLRPKCYFIAHYEWGNVQTRVSFAVLISTNANQDVANHQQLSNDLSGSVVVHNPVAAAIGTRPILGVTDGTATYYSMHAPSGVVAGFSRTYVSGMINAASAHGTGNYVIGGDFNCVPANLYNAANPIPNGVLNTSGQATCNANEYDYFTSNNSAANHTALNNVRLSGLFSDHIGVLAAF